MIHRLKFIFHHRTFPPNYLIILLLIIPLIMEKIYTKASMDSSTDFSESYQPLLNDLSANRSKRSPCFRRFQLGFNILASIYILITLPLLVVYQSIWRIPKPYCNLRSPSHLAKRHHSNKRIAPANNAIAHELHPLLFHEFDERYFGEPEDIDTHWHHLLQRRLCMGVIIMKRC
jgi:hypothetical protein